MSLKHALLGFLNYGGLTGYQLKESFDTSVAHFWHANLSQIYPTLSQMEQEGLLTMEVEYQENRPNRKVYHITEMGREELRRWLREPKKDLSPIREAFLIKIFFGAALPKDEILAQLCQQLDLHRAQLTAYRNPVRAGLRESVGATGLARDGVFWHLTLEAGIKSEVAWVAWLEEAIRQVEALEETRQVPATEQSTEEE